MKIKYSFLTASANLVTQINYGPDYISFMEWYRMPDFENVVAVWKLKSWKKC